jgi:N utilization substance protein A
MLGRAIVLVREDQLSLAIGRRGQNVRLASKLCVWDIEIMTREELEEQLNEAVVGFSTLDGLSSDLAERLVGEGFLYYSDLEVIEPDDLMTMGELTSEQADWIIKQAEEKSQEAERAAADERRRQREQKIVEAQEPEPVAEAGPESAEGDHQPAEVDQPPAEVAGTEDADAPAEGEELPAESAAEDLSPLAPPASGEPQGEEPSGEGAT